MKQIINLIFSFLILFALISCNSETDTLSTPTYQKNNSDELSAESPSGTYIFQPYPNPFSAVTTIEIALSYQTFVIVTVQNPLGDVVCTLVSEELEEGLHSIEWDGSDVSGNLLDDGLYFITLSTPVFMQSRVVKLKR